MEKEGDKRRVLREGEEGRGRESSKVAGEEEERKENGPDEMPRKKRENLIFVEGHQVV